MPAAERCGVVCCGWGWEGWIDFCLCEGFLPASPPPQLLPSSACSGHLLPNAWHGVSREMKTSYWHPASPSPSSPASRLSSSASHFLFRSFFHSIFQSPFPHCFQLYLFFFFKCPTLSPSLPYCPPGFFGLVLNYKVRLWLKLFQYHAKQS